MGKNNLDSLLNTLGFIALYKSMLPFSLRGWVNGLGLHVQERKAGRWTRLQAGGKFRSYLDAWQQEGGDWEVKKFDEVVWSRRFARLVEPTMEIADFLNERVANVSDLDADRALVAVEAALNVALHNFRNTGEWSGLPKEPQEVKLKRLEEEAQRRAQQRTQEAQRKRIQLISEYEEQVRADPLAHIPNQQLPRLYWNENRYKDMEQALKRSLKVEYSKQGNQYPNDYIALGKLYLTALSIAVRGKGVPVWGHTRGDVTPEILGYSVEELQILAKENLRKAYEIDTQNGYVPEQLKELDFAIEAATELSSEAFNRYDSYMEEKERERRNRLRESWADTNV